MPNGFVKTFEGATGSVTGNGFLAVIHLDAYDPVFCARRCEGSRADPGNGQGGRNGTDGRCRGFNICKSPSSRLNASVSNHFKINTFFSNNPLITLWFREQKVYERNPVSEPQSKTCPNPPSIAVIKCTLWSSVVTLANATNTGQMREDFEVVVAGSNGYSTAEDMAVKPPVDGGSTSGAIKRWQGEVDSIVRFRAVAIIIALSGALAM